MRRNYFFLPLILIVFIMGCAQNTTPTNTSYDYEKVVSDINIPWGFTFLPDNSMLITDKAEAKLIHYKDGVKTELEDLPEIQNRSQGGIMDVELHPNYASNGWIYLTYSSPLGGGTGVNTALMRFKLDNNKLVNKELLYKAAPNTTNGAHFGSRIEFDRQGYLYFTIGDRGKRDENPQSIIRDGGKVYRLNDDGSIPADNPFLNTANSKKAIYSYGHRNPQGMAIHPQTGDIWTHEHGPRGGDEINVIAKGKNYGWPTISYGINYDGSSFTDDTAMDGMEQPLHYWVPSIAPSGMAFVTSNVYPELKGHLLVGSLKFQYVNLCVLDGQTVVREERLLDGVGRVRSLRQGPDGYIYVGVENLGIVKIIQKN